MSDHRIWWSFLSWHSKYGKRVYEYMIWKSTECLHKCRIPLQYLLGGKGD